MFNINNTLGSVTGMTPENARLAAGVNLYQEMAYRLSGFGDAVRAGILTAEEARKLLCIDDLLVVFPELHATIEKNLNSNH